MSIRRFIPDFKLLTGDAQITINLRKFQLTLQHPRLSDLLQYQVLQKKLIPEQDQDLLVLKLQIPQLIKVGDMELLGQMYNQME